MVYACPSCVCVVFIVTFDHATLDVVGVTAIITPKGCISWPNFSCRHPPSSSRGGGVLNASVVHMCNQKNTHKKRVVFETGCDL